MLLTVIPMASLMIVWVGTLVKLGLLVWKDVLYAAGTIAVPIIWVFPWTHVRFGPIPEPRNEFAVGIATLFYIRIQDDGNPE